VQGLAPPCKRKESLPLLAAILNRCRTQLHPAGERHILPQIAGPGLTA